MERAFYASDQAWDGRFVAAVRTTGIFCRPSCRVRKPLPKNVEYLADAPEARAAGYRPCLRCQPESAHPVRLRHIATPIGRMTIGATDAAVVLADFSERPLMPAQLASVRRRIGPTAEGDAPLLDAAEDQLREYFAGKRSSFDLPLDLPGSAFQERVWGELARIPYGETISYRELAGRVGVPAGTRAVGPAAVGWAAMAAGWRRSASCSTSRSDLPASVPRARRPARPRRRTSTPRRQPRSRRR
jgi:methylphosphotriester-DNA--protein-cysteine methyltransferase